MAGAYDRGEGMLVSSSTPPGGFRLWMADGTRFGIGRMGEAQRHQFAPREAWSDSDALGAFVNRFQNQTLQTNRRRRRIFNVPGGLWAARHADARGHAFHGQSRLWRGPSQAQGNKLQEMPGGGFVPGRNQAFKAWQAGQGRVPSIRGSIRGGREVSIPVRPRDWVRNQDAPQAPLQRA